MKKHYIIAFILLLNTLFSHAQDKLELISTYNYITTTQFDGTKRTSKFKSALLCVNSSNNFVIGDEEIKDSKSLIYLNNTQREEKEENGKMVIHYDSPKYGKNQLAYLDDNSLTLILPNKQKLIFTYFKPTNTIMVE